MTEQPENAAHSTRMKARILFLSAILTVSSLAGKPGDTPRLQLAKHGKALRIAVVGDTGNGSEAVAAGIRRVHAGDPLDAIILTGDTFYPCGITSRDDPRWSLVSPLTSIGPPLFPVLGNHDYCGK